MLSATIPVRTKSEANLREHWAKRAKRAKLQRGMVRNMLGAELARQEQASLPRYRVTLTRIAPRRLDSDNCCGALKATRDGVADWLGIDDGSDRLEWVYAQERGQPREYAVRVEIQEL